MCAVPSWAVKKHSKNCNYDLQGLCNKLRRARSRLYRNKFLQINMRWKALAEIYTMHSFAPFSDLNFFVKNAESFADFLNRILQNLPDFC